MRHIFFFFSFSIITLSGICQLIPEHNPDSLIIANKVKSCSSYYQDPDTGVKHLIQKLDYDANGNPVREYLLSLWDVISYDYTTTYVYNKENQLVEILKIQKLLKLYPKDEDYIQSFGDAPVNEKFLLSYNDEGQLIKKEIFVFHSSHFDNAKEANRTITYEYEDGRLAIEVSASPETRVFNYNYSIKYDYDSVGNLIRKLREFGTEKPLRQETRYKYDSTGLVIEKEVIDPAVPHNNAHEKYEYDSASHLVRLYEYSDEEDDFVLETTYAYNQHGQRISGDREVAFEYFDNGLIKSEWWKDPKTSQEITFTTQYQYY